MLSTPLEQITLLEKLHILAQTESLALDEGDWPQLELVVSAKESLVAQITGDSRAPESPALRRRAAQLLDLIRRVDEDNRIRLENLRAASQNLQAYSRPAATLSSFSRVAE
jgi:hypothetical protein